MSCMNIKIAFMWVLLLSLLANCSAEETVRQSANFQGDFNSMQYQTTNQQNYGDEEEQYDNYMEEQQDMLEFSEHLGEFLPDETFTFRLEAGSEQRFAIWPGASVTSVRGMFHCEVVWDDDQDYESAGYVDLSVVDGSTVVRQYKHQRLGVFNHPHNYKDNKFHFVFKSHDVPVQVYFSYEMITLQKTQTKESNTTESQLQKVSKSFARVSSLLTQQQREMSRLIELGEKHSNRLRSHLEQLYWRGVIEGLALFCSAFVSVWMLKRQIYQQYQSLV